MNRSTRPARFIDAVREGIADVASLKLNSFGGLSKLRLLCDLGVELGVPMRIENYVGSGILLAAVTHLALTLPERNVFGLYDYVVPGQTLVRNPLQVIGGYVGWAMRRVRGWAWRSTRLRSASRSRCWRANPNHLSSVIPAKAGIQGDKRALRPWIPAFAGMTGIEQTRRRPSAFAAR